MLSELRYVYASKYVLFILIYKCHTIFFNERISRPLIKICIFSMGWNLKHETLLEILVYTFLSTCFYIICVCWIRICPITFYIWWPSPFKLAKHKMATKLLRKHHIFYSLSHIESQFRFSDFFKIYNYFLCLWKELTFIWP